MPNLRTCNGSPLDNQSVSSLDSVEEERVIQIKEQQHPDSSSMSSGNDETLLVEEVVVNGESLEPDDGNKPVSYDSADHDW